MTRGSHECFFALYGPFVGGNLKRQTGKACATRGQALDDKRATIEQLAARSVQALRRFLQPD